MKLFIAYLLFFTWLNVPLALAEDPVPAQVARFLDSRKLVSIVYFKQDSSILSSQAMKSIDSAVARLSRLDMKKILVRIEGFAPLEGDEEVSVPLSMNRALSVMNYVREQYHLKSGLFLISCGDRDLSEVSEDKRRRVEIVLYDNIWDLEDAPVDDLILNW